MIYTLSIHLYPYAYPHLHHIYSIVSYRYWYSVVYIYLVSSRPSPSNHAYIHALIALSINASMPFHSPCSSTQPSIQGCIWCKMRMSRSISDPIYSIQQCIRLIVKLTVPEKKKISRNQGETFFSVSFSLPSAWSFRPGTPRGEKKKKENRKCNMHRHPLRQPYETSAAVNFSFLFDLSDEFVRQGVEIYIGHDGLVLCLKNRKQARIQPFLR